MLKNINRTNSMPAIFFSGIANSSQKADTYSLPSKDGSSSEEQRVHVRGSADFLKRKFQKWAPPEWSVEGMRTAPDLDALYGSVQPPRAKTGRISGIQKQERDKNGMVIIHPGRVILNPTLTPELPAILEKIRCDLMDGAVYKWNISRNGQLMLAKSKHPGGEKLGWGHPTLVGGLKEPEARLGGELRFGTLDKNNPQPIFYINNDSGRYGEYEDRNTAMLRNVAERFKELNFPVAEQWIVREKTVALKNRKTPDEA